MIQEGKEIVKSYLCLACGYQSNELGEGATCIWCTNYFHIYEKESAWEHILKCQQLFTSRVEEVARLLNYGAEHISFECGTISLGWYEYCRGHWYYETASFSASYLSMTDEEIKQSIKEKEGEMKINENLAGKGAYQDMVCAYDEFMRKASHVAKLLGYGHWSSDIDFQFGFDEVWVSWEVDKGWGESEEFVKSFPISYFWMSDQEIFEDARNR